MAPTGAGITWGIIATLVGLGFGIGGGYLVKYTLDHRG